jgi:hypothetical protein
MDGSGVNGGGLTCSSLDEERGSGQNLTGFATALLVSFGLITHGIAIALANRHSHPITAVTSFPHPDIAA